MFMCVLTAEVLESGCTLRHCAGGSARKLGVNCCHPMGRSIRVISGTARERGNVYRDTEFMEEHGGTFQWEDRLESALTSST